MAGRQDGGLSSEQIQRMEENRRRAQQRLSNKRALAVGSTGRALPSSSMGSTAAPFNTSAPQHSLHHGPPPAKRQALIPGPSTHQYQPPPERKVIGPPLELMPEYSSTSGATYGTAGSSVTTQRRPVDYTAASASYQHPPLTAAGSSSALSSCGQVGSFHSRDRGAGTGSATVRGTGPGAVSSAAPSTSSQMVLIHVTDCV